MPAHTRAALFTFSHFAFTATFDTLCTCWWPQQGVLRLLRVLLLLPARPPGQGRRAAGGQRAGEQDSLPTRRARRARPCPAVPRGSDGLCGLAGPVRPGRCAFARGGSRGRVRCARCASRGVASRGRAEATFPGGVWRATERGGVSREPVPRCRAPRCVAQAGPGSARAPAVGRASQQQAAAACPCPRVPSEALGEKGGGTPARSRSNVADNPVVAS